MHYRLGTFSLAATTLLLSLPFSWLSLGHFELLSAQAQTSQNQKAEVDRIFQTGIEQFRKGQFRQALETYQRVLAMRRELSDSLRDSFASRTGVAEALHNIASVYEIQGQYENALKFYEQALLIRREVKDRAGEAATLIGLGNTYIAYIQSKLHYGAIKKPEELKSYQEVLKYYEQALVIMREIGDSPNGDSYASRLGEAWSLNGIGMTYNALRKNEDALKFHEQALAIMRELGNREGVGAVLFNIGKAYHGELDRQRESRPISLDFYEQALAIVREIGHRPLEAEILYMMGLTYYNRWHYEDEKRIETVLEFYKQALAVVRPEGNPLLEEIVLIILGQLTSAWDTLKPLRSIKSKPWQSDRKWVSLVIGQQIL
jgi:tetratricopeptide (TPR) repeat protein